MISGQLHFSEVRYMVNNAENPSHGLAVTGSDFHSHKTSIGWHPRCRPDPSGLIKLWRGDTAALKGQCRLLAEIDRCARLGD